MKKLKEQYGIANSIIVMICSMVLFINSFTPSINDLLEISNNRVLSYALNFLFADKGILIKYGAMSYEALIEKGQWWRAFTCIYLHAGILHLGFNMAALLCAGKYVERNIGAIRYIICFNLIGIIEAVAVSALFQEELSVGAPVQFLEL